MPGPPTTADVERALAFQAATAGACSDGESDLPFGRVLATPSLAHVYSLNVVEVRSPGATIDAVRAAMPATRRPSVLLVDEGSQDPLRAELHDWELDDELTMVLERAPEPPSDGRVREGGAEEIAALQRLWLEHDFGSQGPDALEQLMQYMARQRAVRGTRGFVSPDGDAMTLLWSDGETAQVEDVFTHPEARGRGHARALVSHVAALAVAEGHQTVFLVADNADTPKELYERLGFRGAHRALRLTQPVS